MNPSNSSQPTDGSPGSDPAGTVSKLLDGLKGGDRDAVAVVWQRYFQPLVRIASRVLHESRQRDLQLLQQRFGTRLFCDLPRFDPLEMGAPRLVPDEGTVQGRPR